jgi:hypothetical protein
MQYILPPWQVFPLSIYRLFFFTHADFSKNSKGQTPLVAK